jgi:3-deoxy-D-manno-octulosonic-acid transferase
MGIIIYNIIIRSYNFLILLISIFNQKARNLVLGRKKAFKIISQHLQPNSKVIWFHCASLGEFEQGLPVMESIKTTFPDYLLYVSFFSPSGYEVQKSNTLADCIFYLPADTKLNSKKLMDFLNPEIVFFVKYEFWFHYLKTCYERNSPVISISNILRPDQVFFKSYGGFYLKILTLFHHFFVQNEETLELLARIGLTNATLSGDTRFDRVRAISKRHSGINEIEEFKGNTDLIVLGSTWKKDIDLWMHYINNNDRFKYIIAPHSIGEEDLRYIENKVKLNTIRFSSKEKNLDKMSVLLIDNIGMLSRIYRYADITYVGGAFGEGLHNILEPATFGKPIIIGKAVSNKKYQEVVDLMKEGGAFEVGNFRDLEKLMNDLSSDKELYKKAIEATKAYVDTNLGSTDIIMKKLKNILS